MFIIPNWAYRVIEDTFVVFWKYIHGFLLAWLILGCYIHYVATRVRVICGSRLWNSNELGIVGTFFENMPKRDAGVNFVQK